jgi:hypothetical protein
MGTCLQAEAGDTMYSRIYNPLKNKLFTTTKFEIFFERNNGKPNAEIVTVCLFQSSGCRIPTIYRTSSHEMLISRLHCWHQCAGVRDSPWSMGGVPEHFQTATMFVCKDGEPWLRRLHDNGQGSMVTWPEGGGFVEQWLPRQSSCQIRAGSSGRREADNCG